MKEVKTKLLTILLILSLLSVGFLGYYFGARAGYVADETEPWLTQPLQEASYIIGPYNSSHYYARNSTGYGTAANLGYEMLSTLPSNVFNWCFGNVTDGDVFIKSATYLLDTKLDIGGRKRINIKGEGRNSTILKANTSLSYLIGIGDVGWCSIKDLSLEGDNQTSNAIRWTGVTTSTDAKCGSFENLFITETTNYGMNFSRGSSESVDVLYCESKYCHGGIYFQMADSRVIGNFVHWGQGNGGSYVWHSNLAVYQGANIISANYFGGGDNMGILLWECQENIVDGNIIDYSRRHGINLRGADNNTISDNKITSAGLETDNTWSGIKLDNTATYNTVTGNKIFSDSTNKTAYGIAEGAAVDDYNDYFGNTILDVGTVAMLINGANSEVHDNRGFVTENSGMVVNATATTWTITHGLASNATYVGCGFNSTEIDAWKWTSTATTITVTCVNTATADAIRACYWYAIYKP